MRHLTGAAWYNWRVMNRVLARFWMVALAALVVGLPALGPLFDHHFAERLPYHAHVGAANDHEHGYRHLHSHDAERSPDWNPALYKLDTSPTALTIVLSTDSELGGWFMPDNDSALRIPGPEFNPLKSAYVSPPDRPPRSGLLAFASL